MKPNCVSITTKVLQQCQGDLKSDYKCEAIEKLARSIESKIWYLCDFYFINVTTFDFLGDIIVEAANYGLKRGVVTVSTNMNIDTQALNQIQISKTQKTCGHTHCVKNFDSLC